MNEKLLSLKDEIKSRLGETQDLTDLDKIRVSYLGKKGSITALLKGMKDLPNEERKTFGAEVNKLKAQAAQLIEERLAELKEKEIQREIALMPQFDITSPVALARGSYHPITLVQRECEKIFSSMGFNIEDYSEIVTDYECFEALNIPKHHPARDMQDTYYLDNGQLLKSHTSAAQNAILKKYGKGLIENGTPIKAIFPGSSQSYCILISDKGSKTTRERLDVMCSTNNGFVIADEDLKMRGPGDFFGHRQHGLPQMSIADFADTKSLELSQKIADCIMDRYGDIRNDEIRLLKAEVDRLFERGGQNALN